MTEHRIIKASVRRAIDDAVHKNKQRNIYDSKTWRTERYRCPIILPGGKQFIIELMGNQVLTDLSNLPAECYDAVLSRAEVYSAIEQERNRQDSIWGPNKPQSLPGFLIMLEAEIHEAKLAWAKNITGEQAPLNKITQVAATAIACLEKYGTSGTATATNDIPNENR